MAFLLIGQNSMYNGHFRGVEPGSLRFESSSPSNLVEGVSGDSPSAQSTADLRSDPAYMDRKSALLQTPVPDDGFPEAHYNEDWFTSREVDLDSDEEVGGPWDDSDLEDVDDDEEEELASGKEVD